MTRTGAATHNSRAKVFEVHAVAARLAYGIAFYTAALWMLDISENARLQIAWVEAWPSQPNHWDAEQIGVVLQALA
jgi:hypothetical protein